MRIVLDANVVVSAMLHPLSTPGRAVAFVVASHHLIVTSDITDEWEDVIRRPKFDRFRTYKSRVEFLEQLTRIGILVIADKPVVACRDPKDDKYLEAAVAGAADVIVSGDDDLLSLHPFRGIAILAPHDFVAAYSSPIT